MLYGDTVVIGWLHTQAGQDLPGIVDAFLVPVRGEDGTQVLRTTASNVKHARPRVPSQVEARNLGRCL